jgi:16S rRNA processing protein RimM
MRSNRPTIDEARRGSDEKKKSAEPRFIAIGRVIRPHGVRGELAVEVLTDFPERFDAIQAIYLGDPQQADKWQVASTRWHKDRILLTLPGCEDRTTAEGLRGLLVQIPIEEAMSLPEDEYYPYQLVGLDVVTVEGDELGRLSEVIFTKANEVYVVVGPRGQILLPAIADVVDRVDLDSGRMVVRLIDGLL